MRTPTEILKSRADRVAVPIVLVFMWLLDVFEVTPFYPSVAIGFVLAGAYSSFVYDRALVRSAHQAGYHAALQDMVKSARAIQAADLAGKSRPEESPTD